MLIVWAALLYLVCAVAVAILLGRCVRFGLRDAGRTEDILHRFSVARNTRSKRSRKSFRPAAVIRAGK